MSASLSAVSFILINSNIFVLQIKCRHQITKWLHKSKTFYSIVVPSSLAIVGADFCAGFWKLRQSLCKGWSLETKCWLLIQIFSLKKEYLMNNSSPYQQLIIYLFISNQLSISLSSKPMKQTVCCIWLPLNCWWRLLHLIDCHALMMFTFLFVFSVVIHLDLHFHFHFHFHLLATFNCPAGY